MKKFLFIICAALMLAGCAENSQAGEVKTLNTIKISVGDKIFNAELEDNASTRAFAEMFPLEVEMSELNGNEKYFYLNKKLPAEAVGVKEIFSGDLMLYGSNCVVIFYKDFSTPYDYTRLGKIENASELEKFLGAGNVVVKFMRND